MNNLDAYRADARSYHAFSNPSVGQIRVQDPLVLLKHLRNLFQEHMNNPVHVVSVAAS